VLASILKDIGALQCLQNFINMSQNDDTIGLLLNKGNLKPGKFGLPEDKYAVFIEKCRERLGVQSTGDPSSSGATEGRLPTRLPLLPLARDADLPPDHPDSTASASDANASSALLTGTKHSSSQSSGAALPASPVTGSSAVSPADSASPADARAVLALMKLEVLEELGRGGFGIVFKRKSHKRMTAVKLVNNPLNANEARREGEKMQRVDHPNIVRMYAIHEISDLKNGPCALEMEIVLGGDLSKHLEACRQLGTSRNRLPHEAVLRFSRQLLEAIDYLHDKMKFLHGDIKPQNILMQCSPVPADGSAVDYSSADIKLADFGLAKVMDQQNSTASFMLSNASTKAGEIKGTTWYLSPEALQGADRTYSDDLWSACLVILEMDTGLTLQQLMTAPGAVKLDELLTKTSKELLPLLRSVLAVTDAASRCKSAAELLGTLEASTNPLFIWQYYCDENNTFVTVHPASSVVLEEAFSAGKARTALPLQAPLDLQFDITDLLVSPVALGYQTRTESSGKKCRIRRVLRSSVLAECESIPIWQEMKDGKEWRQCSPSICAKLEIDLKNSSVRVDAAKYRRMTLDTGTMGTVQLPHVLTSEVYRKPAQAVDCAMLNNRVHHSLDEWDVTEALQIFNPALAEQYAANRHRVAVRCNGDPNERMVFHLASDFVIPKIWEAGEGVETRLAQWSEVGKGAYFSEHLIYNYAYKYGLWAPPEKMEDKSGKANEVSESSIKIGEKMHVFAVMVCLGNVKDMGPGCETCPSPEFKEWKKEYFFQKSDKNPNPLPTRPPIFPTPSDPVESLHMLDLFQVKSDPRYDSVMSTEGDLATHPDSRCKTPKGRHVRDILHPRLKARAKEWGKQYVLFKPEYSYPMFLLTLTKTRDSPMGPQQLMDAGCDVARIKDHGFDASNLKASGKTVQEMRSAGWSILDLKGAGYDAKSLWTGGCSLSELRIAGFTESEVRNSGADLSDAEMSLSQVRASLRMQIVVAADFLTVVYRQAAKNSHIAAMQSVRFLRHLCLRAFARMRLLCRCCCACLHVFCTYDS
jgi:serine/threonine protein kinase